MSDQSKKSSQTISRNSSVVTSSAVLPHGITRSLWQDGTITEASPLPAPAPASPSPRQDVKVASVMSAISGRTGRGSLASADLTQSLVSRYRERTDMLGSILFVLTWKNSVTPSGRSVPRLAASGRRTSGSGFTSWQSPNAGDAKGRTYQYDQRDKSKPRLSNEGMAIASWPTPRTPTGGAESAERKQELGRTESGGGDLQAIAALATWATPSARDFKSNEAGEEHHAARRGQTRGKPLSEQAHQLTVSGETPTGSAASTEKRGQLNPEFSLWLMGIPTEWVSCVPQATRSSRSKRRSS